MTGMASMSDQQQQDRDPRSPHPVPQWAVGPDWCGFSPPTSWGPAYGAIAKNPPGQRAP
jgi:hypothetical protein